jgi:hypothetical protein
MAPKLAGLARTLVLSIGIAGFASSIAAAQTPGSGGTPPASETGALPLFASAIQGKEVWISADGARVRGRVTSVDSSGLVLVENGVPTTIPYKNIVRVEKSTHRLRTGTLIGVASGAGFGLWLGAVYCAEGGCSSSEVVGVTAFYAGIGAAAGVGIGAIVHGAKRNGDVIYDARRSTTTMSISPILSPTQKGAAFSMTWR